MIRFLLFIFLTVIYFVGPIQAQQVDTLKKVETPQANKKKGLTHVQKATLYSIVPGGGQIYNKSYWKVPVIYAGFGALTYSFIFYNDLYNEVRQAYIQKLNGEPVTNPDYANVPEEMLYNWRESYKKYRDLSAIGLVGWYAFNLLDAAVDAHLKEFDVSESLSLKVKPQYQISPMGSYAGVSLKLRF